MHEEDEGFILNEIEVTSKKTLLELKCQLDNGLALIESKKPSDFVPRQMSYLKYFLKYPLLKNVGRSLRWSPKHPSNHTNPSSRVSGNQRLRKYAIASKP
jgi:hypothetical protein